MSNSPSPSSTAGSAAEHPDASSAVTSSAQDGASPSTTILATDLQEKALVSTTAGNKRKAVKIASPQHDSQIKKTTTSPNGILQPTKPEAEASSTGTTGKKRRVEAMETQSEPREEIVAGKARRLALHKDITAKIKSYSGEIEIFFDRDPSGGTFSVHRGLLDLHTKYFKQWIKLDNKYVDNFFEEVIHLMSYVDPTYFGQLVSWINTGELLPLEGHVSKSEQLEGMWNLGACVVMPAFQNDCMDELRKYCKETNESGEQWPTLESLLNDHPAAGKYSPLRKFLVHCFTFHNAFANLEYGSEKYREYENLVTKNSNRYVNFDVCVAVALASGKDWHGISPWDDVHRAEYMVDTEPLDQLWDKMILQDRTEEDVYRETLLGDHKPILELAHLRRTRATAEGGSQEPGQGENRSITREFLMLN